MKFLIAEGVQNNMRSTRSKRRYICTLHKLIRTTEKYPYRVMLGDGNWEEV